jgi:predicted dehydrogenase
MTHKVRSAVVGVGYFGRFHASKYANNPRASLVAVVDVDEARAVAVASELGCEAMRDHRQLIGRVDAASIAVSTPFHAEIARDLIEAGIHVLIEKPMTHDVASAQALLEVADRHGRVLQVGHIERFSACFRALSQMVKQPLFLESHRISHWQERGSDVDVIFDLMIHDIDIIVGLVNSPVVAVHAVGTPVFSRNVDLANARISFASGCVANVTASRVSHKTERSLRVFQASGYHVCDFVKSRVFSFAKLGNVLKDGAAAIAPTVLDIPPEDNLANEIDAFLDSILSGRQPLVDARAGYEAIRIAGMINASIVEYRQNFADVKLG